MTDYSKLSNPEINAAVAERVYRFEVKGEKDCYRCDGEWHIDHHQDFGSDTEKQAVYMPVGYPECSPEKDRKYFLLPTPMYIECTDLALAAVEEAGFLITIIVGNAGSGIMYSVIIDGRIGEVLDWFVERRCKKIKELPRVICETLVEALDKKEETANEQTD